MQWLLFVPALALEYPNEAMVIKVSGARCPPRRRLTRRKCDRAQVSTLDQPLITTRASGVSAFVPLL